MGGSPKALRQHLAGENRLLGDYRSPAEMYTDNKVINVSSTSSTRHGASVTGDPSSVVQFDRDLVKPFFRRLAQPVRFLVEVHHFVSAQ